MDARSVLAGNPADGDVWVAANVDELAASVERFGISCPWELSEFWSQVGTGFFGDRRIWVFGANESSPGRSLPSWHSDEAWSNVYPKPADGGPIFFAETAFGGQIGFRWDEGHALPILFIPDTFDAFVLAENLRDLVEGVLGDPFALVDPQRWTAVRRRLGVLPPHHHYAPIQSPVLGGTDEPSNFQTQDAVVHLRTAVAEHVAVAGGPVEGGT